jgi:putative membrane protein
MPFRLDPVERTAVTPTPRRRSRALELALVAAGVALLAALVHRLGSSALMANLRLVGWGIVLIVAQEIFAIVANTLGWRAAFPAHSALPLRHLIAPRIAGDAVNYVTPTATLGGELVRARLLHDRAARLDVATSIAIAKLSQTIAQLGFIAVGVIVAVAAIPLSGGLRLGLIATTAALSALGVAVWAAQRRGMFAPLVRLAARFDRHDRLADLGRRMQRLDAEIARVHQARGRPFVVSSGWFFVGWALGTVEIALMLWLLGVPVTPTRVLAIEALSAAIDATLFFVPGKLGTQEGGKVLIFAALGLDPALGLSIGVLRRIRELAWALIGLLILGRFGVSRDIQCDTVTAPPARMTAD